MRIKYYDILQPFEVVSNNLKKKNTVAIEAAQFQVGNTYISMYISYLSMSTIAASSFPVRSFF